MEPQGDNTNNSISVIIPTFNRYEFTKKAIKSVKKQTRQAVEIIVVDDGSTDNTHLLKNDRDIIYLPIPHNGNPGFVRNRGVEAASGRYIAFLDSDDLWEKNKLELQLAFMAENPALRISHTRELWLRNNKTISQKTQKHVRQGDMFEDALKKCTIGPSTVLLEKSLYTETGGFREDLEIAEDYEYWLRITAANQVGYIDTPLTRKIAGHDGQLSEKYGHIEYFRIMGLKDLVDSAAFPEQKQQTALKALAEKCRIYALGCYKREKADEGDRFVSWYLDYQKEYINRRK